MMTMTMTIMMSIISIIFLMISIITIVMMMMHHAQWRVIDQFPDR